MAYRKNYDPNRVTNPISSSEPTSTGSNHSIDDSHQSDFELLQPTSDLTADMEFLVKEFGFRLLEIYPSDDPAVALLSASGLKIRLDRGFTGPATTIRLTETDDLANRNKDAPGLSIAPNGMRVERYRRSSNLTIPATEHKFEVRRLRDGEAWVIGRAGMHYRDLIPDRLGGSIIASHIRIPDGGPVPDMVHYHAVGFQLIYCFRGWVKLVYEDQGPPFILSAGDCVTQPPTIRHRVLEASENLEVVEIAVPAEHMTTIDHEMSLPTGRHLPDREFGGQTFCHHQRKLASWLPWRVAGFLACDTGVASGSNGVACVKVVRKDQTAANLGAKEGSPGRATTHTADILFSFVLAGAMELESDSDRHDLQAGDAFVIPPAMPVLMKNISEDFEMLEVALPGAFQTNPAAASEWSKT